MEPIDKTVSSDADTVDLSALEGDQFAALSKDGKDKRTRNWAGRWPGLGAGGQAWFLLSGVLIFVGCYLLNAAAHLRKDELTPVLVLVAVFSVYELAVLGLGVVLCRRGETLARRGGGLLLGLAVLLMADTTFVYNELSIAAPRLGGVIAAAAAGFAVFKLAVIARALKLRWGRGVWLMAALGLGVVFGLPLAARGVTGGTGRLSEWFTLGVWWGLAALGAGALWAASDPRRRGAGGTPWGQWLLGVTACSALLHVLGMHWVYRGALTPAHFSPVLLMLSVVLLLRADRSWNAARRWAVACGYAGLLSAGFADEAWHLRVWLIAGALGYGCVWWRQRTLGLLWVWPTMGVAAALGHTPGVMVERIVYAAQQVWEVLRFVTPRTVASWGVAAVTLAFVTLGVGAWSSTRSTRDGAEVRD